MFKLRIDKLINQHPVERLILILLDFGKGLIQILSPEVGQWVEEGDVTVLNIQNQVELVIDQIVQHFFDHRILKHAVLLGHKLLYLLLDMSDGGSGLQV